MPKEEDSKLPKDAKSKEKISKGRKRKDKLPKDNEKDQESKPPPASNTYQNEENEAADSEPPTPMYDFKREENKTVQEIGPPPQSDKLKNEEKIQETAPSLQSGKTRFGKNKSKVNVVEPAPDRFQGARRSLKDFDPPPPLLKTTGNNPDKKVGQDGVRTQLDPKEVEYLKFPTVLGWYFDGCFIQNYSLNEEYAEYFAELEDERDAVRDFELAETFTEMAARNFWPPKYYGPFFRNRGVYLDYPEIKDDPPKAPPEVFSDKQKLPPEVIRRKQYEKSERRKLVKKQLRLQAELEYVNFPTVKGWYFDGFFTRPFALNEEHATVFNELEEGIAHRKEMSFKETFTEKTRRNFWPPQAIGSNCLRTRGVYMDLFETKKDPPHTPPQIDYEHITPSPNRYSRKYSTMYIDPNDTSYYEDERKSTESKVKFLEASESTASVQPYARLPLSRMGSNHSTIGKKPGEEVEEPEDTDIPKVMRYGQKVKYLPYRSKMYNTIREEAKKDLSKKTDYYFDDENVGFFKKNNQDKALYYYDLKYDVWRIKRTPRTFATDFYFDEVAGAYLPKDRNRKEADYIYDNEFCCYKLDGQSGPPKNRLTPDDYVFDERIGKWRRIESLGDEEKKKVNVDFNASRFAVKGQNLNPDDYYFDIDNGRYELKTGAEHDNEKYRFNPIIGAWVEVHPRETDDDRKSNITPNFYFWDETKFCYRRKNGPSAYFIYDPNNKFYRMKKSIKGKYNPKNWRWDESKKIWYLPRYEKSGGYFNEDLHWRPDRDYDKPWLEYVGGYHYQNRKESVEDDPYSVDGTANGSDPRRGTTPSAASTVAGGKGKPTAGRRSMIAGEPSGAEKPSTGGQEVAGKSTTAGPPGTVRKSLTWTPTAGDKSEAEETSVPGETAEGQEEETKGRKLPKKDNAKTEAPPKEKTELEKALEAHDLYDPRVLRAEGLGLFINEVDLKAYFPSVIRVLRPKIAKSDVNEDFALLYFLTDEAAAAALKTMHQQRIKGISITVTYCKKADKKTIEARVEAYNSEKKRNYW